MTSTFFWAALIGLLGHLPPDVGSIRGVVVNGSKDMIRLGGAQVVLRVQLDGQFVVAAEAVANDSGEFTFDNIPTDSEYIYLPGANHEGIHYPGSRIQLSRQAPTAQITLTVYETVSEPCPLVVLRHDIAVQPEANALRVTESLLIDNPTSFTYVGQPAPGSSRATTLRLSIPADFRRTTFHKEFYGRQFTLIDGHLVTDVPWTPGQREVAFTYVLPNENRCRIWERPTDLPCDHLRIDVHTQNPDQVQCNLSRTSDAPPGSVTFESIDHTLPAGYLIRLQLQKLPMSFAVYGRWLALAALAVLVIATALFGRSSPRINRRSQSSSRSASKRAA